MSANSYSRKRRSLRLIERRSEMSILDVIKEIKRTPIEEANVMFTYLAGADHALFKNMEKQFNYKRAMGLHKKIWLRIVAEIMEDAMLDLNIKTIEDIPTLAKVVRYIYDKMCIPLKISKNTSKLFAASIIKCPMIAFSTIKLDEKKKDSYYRSLAEVSRACLAMIVKKSSLSDKVEAKQEKSIALEEQTHIIIRFKDY